MSELDVALTDYLLTIEAAAFAWALAWRGWPWHGPRLWSVVFFIAVAASTALGGTVHAFFPGVGLPVHDGMWTLTMLAIGVAAYAGWMLGAEILPHSGGRRWVRLLAGLQLAAFAVVVLFLVDEFWVAVVDYLPAVLFLLGVLAFVAWRDETPGAGTAASGLVVTLLAAAIQQTRTGVPLLGLSDNAVYHLVQAVGLALLFLGLRRLIPSLGEVLVDAT